MSDSVVWIIEMWMDRYRRVPARWEATIASALTKSDAHVVMREWRFKNPNDKFRVALYRRVRPK